MESISTAHTVTLWKVLVQYIPVPYGKYLYSPYRYLMERISTAHIGTLWKVSVQSIPVPYGKY